MGFILRLLITAVVAYGLTRLLPGVQIADLKAALIFALVLAFLNAIVRPLFIILTIPITIVTLGFFLLVINACIILLADSLVDGINVDGFWWAFIFSIILSVISGALHSMLKREKERR